MLDRLRAHSAWLRWRLSRRPVRRRFSKVLFELDFSLSHYVKNMNFGWYQEEIVHLLRALLKRGDVVIDVGANIGYIAAVAADMVGPSGEVHCFEPAPTCFARLKRLAALNPNYRIVVNPEALGETDGRARLKVHQENMLLNAISEDPAIEGTIEVAVRRLDAYIEQHVTKSIALIKIDVEGFEFPVLRGLRRYLATAETLPMLICEIFPSVYSPEDFEALVHFFASYGYVGYDVKALDRVLDVRQGWAGGDVLFMPMHARPPVAAPSVRVSHPAVVR